MSKLTEKQKRFIDEYLIDLNATQAATRAGYSAKTAYSMGQRLLKNVEIQKAVADRQNDLSERTEITQDQIVTELAKIGFAKASDSQLSELKYNNKLKAIELLGRHLGMFTDKVQVEGFVPVRIVDDLPNGDSEDD